jgi:hypothetical protein
MIKANNAKCEGARDDLILPCNEAKKYSIMSRTQQQNFSTDTKKSTFENGSVIRIQGLQEQLDLNGQFGVIKQYHADIQRYEVIIPRGRNTKAIKPRNLTTKNIIQSTDTSFKKDSSYNHVLFWPSINNAIPVQAFPDWPDIKKEEDAFLMNHLKWKNPKVAGGVTSEGNEKPDFVIYFDADDEESPLNDVAQAAIDLLPAYEIGKVPELVNGKKLRGACILVYSPLISGLVHNGISLGEYRSGEKDLRFSHQQLLEVLKFHQTLDARAQYKRHDNAMHRLFGGTPFQGEDRSGYSIGGTFATGNFYPFGPT